MNHAMSAIGILFMLSSAAGAEPSYGTLIGTKDADILNYECVDQNDGKLSCSLVEVLLSNVSDEAKLAESLLQTPEILSDPGEMLETCKSISELKVRIDAVKSGAKFESLSAENMIT
jgi:hypothetical protein